MTYSRLTAGIGKRITVEKEKQIQSLVCDMGTYFVEIMTKY